MFQLALDFLERPFRPKQPVTPPEIRETLSWKHGLLVHLIRRPRARRYLLRLEADGNARLVIPRRGSRPEALRFLERSEPWLLKQRAKWIEREKSRLPWTEGTLFPFRGEEVILHVEEEKSVLLRFADQVIRLKQPMPDYRPAVADHLRKLAAQELPIRTQELARAHNITVHRITVRAQKTLWGSCSARGRISLNWRIIHAPPWVVDYLIIHELMHRREMNHSTRYWKLVAEACPVYREAEQWLKKNRLPAA